MKTLIVNANRCFNPAPVMPLGACIVAEAVERAGFRASLLDLMFQSNPAGALKAAIESERPDLVGLSVRNIDNTDLDYPVAFYKELGPLMDVIRKETRAPVVLGGAALGVMPRELLRHTGAEWAALGDGESALPALLTKLSRGESPRDAFGLGWLEDELLVENPQALSSSLDTCIFPRFERWIDVASYASRLATVPIQTKRGCPYKCVYCTYQALEGTGYRLSSPESVAHAVERLSAIGLKDLEFVDNVFNSPYDHAMGICERIARLKTGARLQSLELNPLFLDDALLSAMEAAGFCGIGVTVESGSDKVLSRLRKSFHIEDAYRAAEAIRRHNIPCLWLFMLGAPGETEETLQETFRFAERALRPRDAAYFNLGVRIYPGTELDRIARAEGLLQLASDEMLDAVFYISPEIDRTRLESKLKKFMASHMNCLSSGSISLPLLPIIHRIAYNFGLRPPLWKHTRYIRRLLRIFMPDI